MSDERVQEALAAYLDHLEMGGPAPDSSHLDPDEQAQLQELISALETTEGVAFGLGLDEGGETRSPGPRTAEGRELQTELQRSLPPDVRIEADTTSFVTRVGGVDLLDGWIVGTFGGRVRVWLLDVAEASTLEGNRDCLLDLGRAFGAFPGTAAIALTARDLSCLIVRPEDCAPRISIPTGSLAARGYRYPIRPVGEAVAGYLNELIPYWDPIPAFERDSELTIDVSSLATENVATAVEGQRASGSRARQAPKKEALGAFGVRETNALTKIATGLFDGSIDPAEIETRIESLAEER